MVKGLKKNEVVLTTKQLYGGLPKQLRRYAIRKKFAFGR